MSFYKPEIDFNIPKADIDELFALLNSMSIIAQSKKFTKIKYVPEYGFPAFIIYTTYLSLSQKSLIINGTAAKWTYVEINGRFSKFIYKKYFAAYCVLQDAQAQYVKDATEHFKKNKIDKISIIYEFENGEKYVVSGKQRLDENKSIKLFPPYAIKGSSKNLLLELFCDRFMNKKLLKGLFDSAVSLLT